MAIPTVSGAAPSAIWTGGQLVTLTGTGFRLPTIPTYPWPGPYPAPKPSVAVTIGGTPATDVQVFSTTTLTCRAAAHAEGAVAIAVQNLDDDGDPIPGELVTTGTNLLSYVRPALDSTAEPLSVRVSRALVTLLEQQVIGPGHVVHGGVHTDFSDDLVVTAMAVLPCLVLVGPNVAGAPEYRRTYGTEIGGPTNTQLVRAPAFVNMSYEIQGFTKHEGQLAHLETLLTQFFERTSRVTVARDLLDPGKGNISLRISQMLATQPIRNTRGANTNNVTSFVSSCVVRGVPNDAIGGLPGENVVRTDIGTVETITFNITGTDGE